MQDVFFSFVCQFQQAANLHQISFILPPINTDLRTADTRMSGKHISISFGLTHNTGPQSETGNRIAITNLGLNEMITVDGRWHSYSWQTT
jgi:hypothetical protein